MDLRVDQETTTSIADDVSLRAACCACLLPACLLYSTCLLLACFLAAASGRAGAANPDKAATGKFTEPPITRRASCLRFLTNRPVLSLVRFRHPRTSAGQPPRRGTREQEHPHRFRESELPELLELLSHHRISQWTMTVRSHHQ